MNINETFTGIFKSEFENYWHYKQSMGFYRSIENKKLYELCHLNQFLESKELSNIMITQEMTEEYIYSNSNISQSTRHIRECTIRQFSKFLHNQGYDNIYIQYSCLVKMPRDYIPSVFSDNEIREVFKGLDKLIMRDIKTKIFYQVLFRLLYGTGMRIGEALSLKIDDVDLFNQIITIHSGKGNVSRLIPYKQSLNIWLKLYYNRCSRPNDEYFFQSPRGGKRTQSAIRTVFKDILIKCPSIKLSNSQNTSEHKRGYCIHTLRHSFACNALDQMIKSGKDPYCALPYLSVYMGHTSIVNTEIYLQLTLQHYNEIVDVGHYIYKKGLGEDNE